MYKCESCGHLFEEGEQTVWKETHGFTDGFYETLSGCPLCKGSYKETSPCPSCGNTSYFADEMDFCVCDECIESYSKNFDFCVKLGNNEKVDIKINGAIASIFEPEEINEILVEYAKNIKNVSFKDFVEQDKDWFAEMIECEVRK